MAITVASFNVENLFERPKVFNYRDQSVGNEIMEKITQLDNLLKEETYTENIKEHILSLYRELKDFIFIREDRGKLFKKSGWSIIGIKASGVNSWDGAIEYKKAEYSEMARENTAEVMKDVKADIACVIEADNRMSLKAFDGAMLRYRYKYEMLIDGNDRRGIDVGILSKFNFGVIKTHIYDKKSGKQVFSRDCLEIEVILSENKSLYLLINHFKSKGYDSDGTADAKRKRQATRVKEILDKYDLENDYVIVAGDLNDTPNSSPLKPLMDLDDMHDVLELEFANDMSKRWTYHYNDFEQIDYILISSAMKEKFIKAGVERRGMYNLRKLTTDSNGQVPIEEQYDTVTHWTNQASDHGAVWVELDV